MRWRAISLTLLLPVLVAFCATAAKPEDITVESVGLNSRKHIVVGDLNDAAALVHAAVVLSDSELLCQAELIVDSFITENLPESEDGLLRRCYAVKRRLSNLCSMGLMAGVNRQEALQIELEIRSIDEHWHQSRNFVKLLSDLVIRNPVAFLLGGLIIGASIGVLGARRARPESGMSTSIGSEIRVNPPKSKTALAADRLSAINQGLSMIDEILPLAASSRDLTYFDNVPIGLVSLSDQGDIRSTNTRFAAMTGMLISELQGKPFAEFLRVGDIAQTSEPFRTLKGRLLDGQVEGWLHHANSEWIPVDVTAADFAAGRRKGLLVSIMDRSARQQVEEMRRGFVSMVSHDLAAPLSSLGLFFDLIRHSAAYQSEDYKLAVLNAEEETGRLMKLVTDLLDVSKLESGKFSLERAEVSAAQLVRNAINSVRYLAEDKDLFLENNCADITINVDPERMMQVLINLLSNAIKFSPADGRIVVEGQARDGGFEFSVSDEGPGVPAAMRELIFDRFAQASAADKRSGAGLGLSICKLIVDQHGGKISVGETEERGARFFVFLPMPTD